LSKSLEPTDAGWKSKDDEARTLLKRAARTPLGHSFLERRLVRKGWWPEEADTEQEQERTKHNSKRMAMKRKKA
jgi:hypothetical protein